jgi:hypothetical protein
MVIFEEKSGEFLWSTDYSFSFEKKEEKDKQFFYKAWIFFASAAYSSPTTKKTGGFLCS